MKLSGYITSILGTSYKYCQNTHHTDGQILKVHALKAEWTWNPAVENVIAFFVDIPFSKLPTMFSFPTDLCWTFIWIYWNWKKLKKRETVGFIPSYVVRYSKTWWNMSLKEVLIFTPPSFSCVRCFILWFVSWFHHILTPGRTTPSLQTLKGEEGIVVYFGGLLTLSDLLTVEDHLCVKIISLCVDPSFLPPFFCSWVTQRQTLIPSDFWYDEGGSSCCLSPNSTSHTQKDREYG